MQISLMQNVTSTAVNSSDEAEQKKAVDKPAKSQQRGHQKTQRLLQQIRKINNTSQGKGLLHSKIKQSRTINQKSETKIFNFKTLQVQVQESSIMQVSGKYFFDNSKRSSCQQQYSTASTNKDCNSKHKKSII